MLPFIAQHIDALITLAGGAFACYHGFRSQPAATPKQQSSMKFLRVVGPLVVLFGILRFFIDQPAAPVWQRHTTSDGVASLEFPATPKETEQADTMNSVSTRRTSLVHNVSFKDISLFFSFSPFPANEPEAPDSARIAATKAFFIQQGFAVVREAPVQLGAASGFAFDLQRDSDKVRLWTRIAYLGGKVYRVVISSAEAHHDDPIITRCLESFRIEKTGG